MKFADAVGAALVLAAGAVLAWQWFIRGSGQVEVQTVKVPVPVACTEPVPTRPTMPTDDLRQQAHVDVDQFVQAALAELARREGYELRLLTALNNCRLPVAPVAIQP